MDSIISARGLDDLVLLDDISEQAVIDAIANRFRNGEIYTHIGPVLTAVNPYKLLQKNGRSIYDEAYIDAYRGRLQHEMPPHVFGVTESAYSALLRYRKAQSIIISGESGSGKTETAKQALSFISRVSGGYAAAAATKTSGGPPGGKKAQSKAEAAISAATRVKDRLLIANIALESFGNSATRRNDNSSRFGKLMTVYFSSSGMAKAGALSVYLLEKNRVVHPGEERNFHIFHQLTAGADVSLRRNLFLENPEKYNYLSREARKIPGVQDALSFKAVVACFNQLGIDTSVQSSIWKTISVVLNLGNIELTSDNEQDETKAAASSGTPHSRVSASSRGGGDLGGGGGLDITDPVDGADASGVTESVSKGGGSINAHAARVADDSESGGALTAASQLMGVDPKDVEKALTTRTLNIQGGVTMALNTPAQARSARDTLAKAIYEKLFAHVVSLINNSISGYVEGAPAANKPKAPAATSATTSTSTTAAPTKASTSTSTPSSNPGAPGSTSGTPTGTASTDKADASETDDIAAAEAAQQAELQAQLAAQQEAEENAWAQISLLDLYGFEDLAPNKFEQLCINFVNERLQALFLDATLRTEQAVYEQEGIQWTPIDYFDNTVVVQLLDGKPGIFGLLDDAAALADSNPSKLIQSVNKAFAKHTRFSATRVNDGTFTVKHYAGDICYDVTAGEGMIVANRDILNSSLLSLMQGATGLPVMQQLFSDKRSTAEKSKRPPTAGQQFRKSVEELVQVLSASEPHYIRCIKPNDSKKPMTVDTDRFTHQVLYLGLTENCRVKRAGFAYRTDFSEFHRRYRMLTSATWPPRDLDDREAVAAMLSCIKMIPKPKDATLGVGLTVNGNNSNNNRGGAAANKPGAGRAAPQGAAGRGGRPQGGPRRPAVAAAGDGGAGTPSGINAAAAAVAGPRGLANVLPGDIGGPESYPLKEGVDYQLGTSMIFIKEPKNLFNLEYMRTLALGKIVSKMAALWRAHDGKRKYAKIKKAWLLQQAHVKGHLQRKAFLRMKAAAVRVQAAVRGFQVRCSEMATNMRESLGMLKFEGSKIRRRMSLRWEVPERADWLGVMIPNTAALTPAAAALAKPLRKHGQDASGIVYTDHVIKIKQDYKLLRRALVVTDGYLLNIADPWEKGKCNRALPIASIEKLSLSPFRDSYIAIHQGGPKGYAFICICETKISLVKALQSRYLAIMGTPLPVEVSPQWTYKANKGDGPEKLRMVQFKQTGDTALFTSRIPSPQDQALLALPGGLGGRPPEALDAAASASLVLRVHMEAESNKPFHDVQPGNTGITVMVPIPRRVGLDEILTDAEKTKLQSLGFRLPSAAGGRGRSGAAGTGPARRSSNPASANGTARPNAAASSTGTPAPANGRPASVRAATPGAAAGKPGPAAARTGSGAPGATPAAAAASAASPAPNTGRSKPNK